MLHCLSSKATSRLLAALTESFTARTGALVRLESIGGVEAAARVRAGAASDVVVLAADVIDALIDEGYLRPGRTDVARSATVVAVRAGLPHPPIDSEAALREAVESMGRIAYSSGPSGLAINRLFERWGIADRLADRLVKAPPGVPVGDLLARGEADLGFQQCSELIFVDGIEILGPLPSSIAVVTTFAAGCGLACPDFPTAQALLAHLSDPAADALKRLEGMEPI